MKLLDKLMGGWLLLLTTGLQAQTDLRLWYRQPAANWNEALPLGNGRIAAMVFGGPGLERLQLNEETVWAGGPHNNVNPASGAAVPELRRLLFEKQFAAAQALSREQMTSPQNGMPYQPVGDLFIRFPGHEAPDSFERELDIGQAVATTTYSINGTRFRRQVFTSLTDGVMVVRLTADRKGALGCSVFLGSPHPRASVRLSGKQLLLSGMVKDHEGVAGQVRYETVVEALPEGGRLAFTDTSLIVREADALTLLVSIASNFRSYKDLSADPHARAMDYLAAARKKPFRRLLQDHVGRYRRFFDRVSLELAHSPAVQLPTDERVRRFHSTFDPELVALYFQYGRYLLIASSQPGGQPANLQGKWNDRLNPPWDSKYTVNINTQMNYWPSEVAALPELSEPLFTMIRELSETGRASARRIYDARGWMMHHNTDLWRITGVVDGGWYGTWPMGGAWLCRHLWEHYLYSGNEEFLERYYPVLKNAAQFYVDALRPEPDHGWLVMAPSMSPENSYLQDSAQNKIALAYGTTMDNQILFELFTSVIRASEVLGIDPAFRDTLERKRGLLPPMQIGRWGQLQEWIGDFDRPNDRHRHISHLYGLYPSYQISRYRTPRLFEAARTTLQARGDRSTGWSMGWKVAFWARMKEGDRAWALIRDQLQPAREDGKAQSGGTYPNLLDAHPPFQIDGNFGCTAGIAEMLLQSQDGVIELLPALPSAWKAGKVRGLKARGGFTIDLEWKDNRVSRLTVHSALGGPCRIRILQTGRPADQAWKAASGSNQNPFYRTESGKDPLIAAAAPPVTLTLPDFADYELSTQAGGMYQTRF